MSYKIRPKREGEIVDSLPTFDFTKLSAINTCPRWGLIRYDKGLAFPHSTRAMALEAGSACHEFFAAVRLYQLGYVQGHTDHMYHHGKILFKGGRFEKMVEELGNVRHEYRVGDWNQEALGFCLQALYDSGFVDDPSDRRRTMSNLEAACIGYFDRWNFEGQKVYVHDEKDPTAFVGVENPIDVIVELPLYDDPNHPLYGIERIRFVGRIDGVHVSNSGELYIHENKTAARLNDGWRMSFHTSHQVTGYCAAMTAILDKPVNKARIIGLAIPRPATGVEAIEYRDVNREPHDFVEWFNWFIHTLELWAKYQRTPEDAPKYTQSCNRYFQPCSFISLCANTDREQRIEIMQNEMVEDMWSPLDE